VYRGNIPLLEKLPAKYVRDLVVIVLLAYHMRAADRLEAIIQEAGQQDRWPELWPKFQEAAEDDETALSHFTQYIMAQLDGGDYRLPEGLSLE
jgi:hypothetical protein